MSAPQMSWKALAISSAAMLVSGTVSSLMIRTQERLGFRHILTSSLLMFIGEYLNIFNLLVPLRLSRKKEFEHFLELQRRAKVDGKSLEVGIVRLGLGGVLDLLSTSFHLVSALLFPPSILQMLRSGTMISVFLFTRFYLKKKVGFQKWASLTVICFGFLLVSFSSFVNQLQVSENSGFSRQFLGLICLIISFLLSGFYFIYQEDLMDRFEVDASRLVAAESVMGVGFLTICLFFTSKIECMHEELCKATFDDPSQAMIYLLSNSTRLVLAVSTVLSLMVFNASGLLVTKNASSIFRILIDSGKTIIFWVMAIVLGLEQFSWKRFALQGPGFALLFLGNLINAEVVPLGKLELLWRSLFKQKTE